MWVIVFVLFVFLTIITVTSGDVAKEEKNCKIKKRIETFHNISLNLLLTNIMVIFLYCLLWVWYYICGGYLVFEVAETFGDVLAYGFISILGLTFVIGFIAVIFGWNPGNK